MFFLLLVFCFPFLSLAIECGAGTELDTVTGKCVPISNKVLQDVKPSIETLSNDLLFTVPDGSHVIFLTKDQYGEVSSNFTVQDLVQDLSSVSGYLVDEMERAMASDAALNLSISALQSKVENQVASSLNAAQDSIQSLNETLAMTLANVVSSLLANTSSLSTDLKDLSSTTSDSLSSLRSQLSDASLSLSIDIGHVASDLSKAVPDLFSNITANKALFQNYTDVLSGGMSFLSTLVRNMDASLSSTSSSVSSNTARLNSFNSTLNTLQNSLSTTNGNVNSLGTRMSTAESNIVDLQKAVTSVVSNATRCSAFGMLVDASGNCISRYGDGSLANKAGASCAQIFADYPTTASGVKYINDAKPRFAFCDMALGMEVAKTPETALNTCNDILVMYQTNMSSARPANGVYTFISGDFVSTYQTYCDFDVDKCVAAMDISGGTLACPNLVNGNCSVTCAAGYSKNDDSVRCVNGYMIGKAFCKIAGALIRDDFTDFTYVTPTTIDTTYSPGLFRFPAADNSRVVTKQSFSSANGLSVEVRLKQISGSKECIAVQVFPQGVARHTGHNFGQGWWNTYIGWGTESANGNGQQNDNTPLGTWRTYRFTRSSGGVNKLYQDGVLKYTWSSTAYTTGVVSIGMSCVDFAVDYLYIVEKELDGVEAFPGNIPHTFGLPWMLAAKVTDDYSWICPDTGFTSNCGPSKSSPDYGNLFHDVHARDYLDTSITKGVNSGVHVKLANLQRALSLGGGQMKFLFADDDWNPSAVGVATMTSYMQANMFSRTLTYGFQGGTDYFWRIEKNLKGNAFGAEVICWGYTNGYRYSSVGYDAGLFMGYKALYSDLSPQSWCHLLNDVTKIQMKSHYATYTIGQPASGSWYSGQHSLLSANPLQVPFRRLSVWIR